MLGVLLLEMDIDMLDFGTDWVDPNIFSPESIRIFYLKKLKSSEESFIEKAQSGNPIFFWIRFNS